jgi:hypothetical protein
MTTNSDIAAVVAIMQRLDARGCLKVLRCAEDIERRYIEAKQWVCKTTKAPVLLLVPGQQPEKPSASAN